MLVLYLGKFNDSDIITWFLNDTWSLKSGTKRLNPTNQPASIENSKLY
jgi:hypothetical protein